MVFSTNDIEKIGCICKKEKKFSHHTKTLYSTSIVDLGVKYKTITHLNDNIEKLCSL